MLRERGDTGRMGKQGRRGRRWGKGKTSMMRRGDTEVERERGKTREKGSCLRRHWDSVEMPGGRGDTRGERRGRGEMLGRGERVRKKRESNGRGRHWGSRETLVDWGDSEGKGKQ